MNQKDVTIVAPATPQGVSALAVVRVSGPNVTDVIASVLQIQPAKLQPRMMQRTPAYDPRTGERLDDLLACLFPGPNSYTGEDVLELFPHGNPLLVRHLVDIIKAVPGVRMAEPGEFTRRAFEAGKIDLVQAEAIGQLLQATTENGLKNANRLLQGKLSGKIHELSRSVKNISALLELEVDFAEEEADADQQSWRTHLVELRQQLLQLERSFRSAAAENKTPLVAFYGAPNVGKSSLVNALLCDDRLLVSPKAGTTRDVVEVFLLLDRGEVRIADTAGISDTPVDELDAKSQQKAKDRIQSADYCVLLVDSSVPMSPEIRAQIEAAQSNGHGIVFTKVDLGYPQSESEKFSCLAVSAHEKIGIESLLSHLCDQLFPTQKTQEEFWVSSERQQERLVQARQGVERAIALLDEGRSAPEELAFELFSVRENLSGITGQISTDAILEAIFTQFCIGK